MNSCQFAVSDQSAVFNPASLQFRVLSKVTHLMGAVMTTAFTRQRVEAIREIILEHLEIAAEELTDHSRFKDDHQADSLRLMDVLAALETKFDIEIDGARFARMVDLHSVCEVVSELADR